ncbi:hypothetical protein [Streptomyces sp. NPDC058155]|uniref:hypothetical protein n=1 Tax=Streptomyces sp. NPDC058155 TaxID=3346359 RepID=UPI0036EBEC28
MKLFGRRPRLQTSPTEIPGWTAEFRDTLDSVHPGLGFVAQFRVEWRRPGPSLAGRMPAGEPCRAVRELAEATAAQHSVLRFEAAEQDINHDLSRRMPLRAIGAEVTWAQVLLSVDEGTHAHAERVFQARREMEIDALTQRQTLARINFMNDEILRTPGSARIYLMLENTVRLGTLPPGTDVDLLVREVQQWRPESQWVVVAQLLHTFLSKLSSADADELLSTVRSLFLYYGEKELAEQLPSETAEAPE